MLRRNEVPSKELPILPTTVTYSTTRKPPKEREPVCSTKVIVDNERTPPRKHEKEIPVYCDKGVNTDVDCDALLKEQAEKIEMLENELKESSRVV